MVLPNQTVLACLFAILARQNDKALVPTQVTSEPDLAPLLSELIHSTEGQEVRLREPSDYHIHDLKKTSFAEVAEYARTKTETAIGYGTAIQS